MQRGPSIVVPRVQVGAGVEQGGDNLAMAFPGSKVQRGPSIVVPRVQIGTIGEQGSACLVVASGGSIVQGGANGCLHRRAPVCCG